MDPSPTSAPLLVTPTVISSYRKTIFLFGLRAVMERSRLEVKRLEAVRLNVERRREETVKVGRWGR